MSCENLEPIITITKAKHRRYDVTRHRRDCGMLRRSMIAPRGGLTINQTEFLNRGVSGEQGPFEYVPRDHKCMKRRNHHLALAESVTV